MIWDYPESWDTCWDTCWTSWLTFDYYMTWVGHIALDTAAPSDKYMRQYWGTARRNIVYNAWGQPLII